MAETDPERGERERMRTQKGKFDDGWMKKNRAVGKQTKAEYV